jgi:thiamine transport system permease protein
LSLARAPILFLLWYFFCLSKILILAFNTSALYQANFQLILSTISFTFYQATLSTILTFILGIPSAILFSRFNFRGKSLLRALTAVPFMLPTVVVASSFNALFGNHGLFSFFILHPSPFILILTAHIFYNTTIVIRIVGNALSRLDPKLEQSARSLGADTFHVWKNIILPLLLPSLLAAALLVFMFDFTSFGVILLLGGSNFSTLEVEIYLRVLKLPNLPLAALLSIVQLIFTLIFPFLTPALSTKSPPKPPALLTSRPPKTIRERIFVLTFTYYFLLFSSPLSRPPPPLPYPPRSGPRSARRSPIWIHN